MILSMNIYELYLLFSYFLSLFVFRYDDFDVVIFDVFYLIIETGGNTPLKAYYYF